MKAFIGRLICCVVRFPTLRLLTASYDISDCLDLAHCDKSLSELSKESASHDSCRSSDSDELDNVDGYIITQVAVSFSKMMPLIFEALC